MSRRYTPDLWALFLLSTAVIVCFWRIALAGRVLAGGDVFTYFYPYWSEATRALRAWRIPLWNPYLFMGAPFLANSQVGFFYPLNWPLWLLFPPHRSVHLSIVVHLVLAACNGYAWGRCSLRLGQPGAWVLGAAFALGGYLGAQVEHVNQLQALAWLPLALLLWDRGWRALTGLALLFGLILLAGHTQTAFILFVGTGIYALSTTSGDDQEQCLAHCWIRRIGGTLLRLIIAGTVGGALAAVQLVPAWELARLSIRAGGLPFNERLSFSLSPLYLGRALLPGFFENIPPHHIEHVAHIGISGLTLALVGLWGLVIERRSQSWRGVLSLALTGLFLSPGLYNPLYVLLASFAPGFADFRVPARWLALYASGVAALAGYGVETLFKHHASVSWRKLILWMAVPCLLIAWAVAGTHIGGEWQVERMTGIGWVVAVAATSTLLALAHRSPGLATCGLIVLMVTELFGAATVLPHARATAPQAFTGLRPAVAHLLAAGSGEQPPCRFISMSDLTFDPGDLPEIKVLYGPQLSPSALYDYIVATKHKEVLSPNLPLVFGIPAVDGYDGGILPLARYLAFQRLLVGGEGSMDGRLRENLTTIPDGRWLNLCNVRYIITDKLRDAWLDGVFYDLQFGARLERGQVARVASVPPFEATALGLVSYLEGGASLAQGTPVGVVEIGFDNNITHTFELRAGEHTAEGLYGPYVMHTRATVGGNFWPGEPRGNDYVTRLRWQPPSVPLAISVRATLPEGRLVVRGVSLVDERTGSFQALVLSDRGHFRLVHSGDVKVYENMDVLPRAFLVHKAKVVGDSDAASLSSLESDFDPAAEVLLADGTELDFPLPDGEESVMIRHYAPERIEIEVSAAAPGYLVLSDAWYPGWEARVDGTPVPVRRANLLFRAVAVDTGVHVVEFTFRPRSLFIGLGISLVGVVLLLVQISAYPKNVNDASLCVGISGIGMPLVRFFDRLIRSRFPA